VAPRNAAPGLYDRASLIEEIEVERKAHTEGVDAGATGDQQARAGLLKVEMGKTEEPSPEASGDWHFATEHDSDWQTAQTHSGTLVHADPSASKRSLSPTDGLTSHFFVHSAKKCEVTRRPVLIVVVSLYR
jgi:hypothetical protein